MQSLGTLGGQESSASAINDAGQIVGEAQASNGIYKAFLYANGTMYNLGSLGNADSESVAHDINSYGHIVGSSELGPDDGWARRAFLYTGTPGVDGQMINLDAWLDEVNPVEGAKWVLTEAYGINDSGLIVGYGSYYNGVSWATRAFLLDASTIIPEPSSLLLVLAGAVGLMRRRRLLNEEPGKDCTYAVA